AGDRPRDRAPEASCDGDHRGRADPRAGALSGFVAGRDLMATVEMESGASARMAVEMGRSAAAEPAIDWIHLLGVPISRVTREEALTRIEGFIRSKEPHLVVTADSSAIVIAAEDDEFRRIVNGADLVTPDSTGRSEEHTS